MTLVGAACALRAHLDACVEPGCQCECHEAGPEYHVVGHCPVCGAPIFDSGYDDDPEKWWHAEPACSASLPNRTKEG